MTDSLDQALSERFARQHDDPPAPDFADVLRRATQISGHLAPRGGLIRQRLRADRGLRRVVVAAVAVAVLVGAGVAIAAGFGAFNGISAAQHPPTKADRLSHAVRAWIAEWGKQHKNFPLWRGTLEPASARLVRRLPYGPRIYAVATTSGDLCVVLEQLPPAANLKKGAFTVGCTGQLTHKDPTTAESERPNEQVPAFSWGVALNSIRAVSWNTGKREVTVPVIDNVWAYKGAIGKDFTFHFKDGSTGTLR
jgi:hypothetical protein